MTETPAPSRKALSIADLEQYKLSPVDDPTYPANMRTFYAPHDNVHETLKAVISSTTKSLVVAMFGYDDEELAKIIADFIDNPNIYVQVTLDNSQAGGVHERAILEKYKHEMSSNSVAIGSSEKGAIMHRKMVIVDGLWRMSGSTNWSDSGESKQDNELTVIQSSAICAEARHILDIEHNKVLQQMAKKAVAAAEKAAKEAATPTA